MDYYQKSIQGERDQLKVIWGVMDVGLLQDISRDIETEIISRRRRKKTDIDLRIVLDKAFDRVIEEAEQRRIRHKT
jgi:hypothetical protein